VAKANPTRLQLAAASMASIAAHCGLFVFVLGHSLLHVPLHQLREPALVVALMDVPAMILLYPAREWAYAADPRPGPLAGLLSCWGVGFYLVLAFYAARLGVISPAAAWTSSISVLFAWPLLFGVPLYYLLKTRTKRPSRAD
jgi:hypothetical protein